MQDPWVVLLGTAQDGGFPQAGCRRPCCVAAWQDQSLQRLPCCLGIVDPKQQQRWMIDCSPSFPRQLFALDEISPSGWPLAGILLSHAHVGHYVGLVQLGREISAAQQLQVYAMPRMKQFLSSHAPWSLLFQQAHAVFHELQNQQRVPLSPRVSVTPFEVTHRDELSETVGFRIVGPNRSALYLTDIDHFDDIDLPAMVEEVDIAWVDGTFFNGDELPNRDLSVISHPFVEETVLRFASLAPEVRKKISFIHLNHSNPLCRPDSPQRAWVEAQGFSISAEGERFSL